MFKIFAFKGIFIVSMYILIVYCFLYLFKYQIYPYNNEKNHYEKY
jgi:ABC-type antimicrobial peptide transport system permease subunit